MTFQTTPWTLVYSRWDPEQQPLREALCTLGNGFFATRGAAEESRADGPHYPGTYLAGGYNRLQSKVAGRVVENEDLVNWPNWLCLKFRPQGGSWFDLQSVEVLDFRQELDVHRGVLGRRVRFRDPDEREFTLVSRRLVHMAHPHLAAIQWTLTAENWSGTLELESALDGTVINHGVERYRQLNSHHLQVQETGAAGEQGIWLAVQTNQSRLRMAQAARTEVLGPQGPLAARRSMVEQDGYVAQQMTLDCQQQVPIHIEKVAAVYTSRDDATSEPGLEARKAIGRAGRFAELLDSHTRRWAHLWEECDIELADNDYAQFVLRLHIFHLLQTTSPNTIGRDVGVPARGLHGEAYRGHIFWDELFIFPLLDLWLPELTRSLLMYRYRRLPEARWAAHEAGYQGAMFPWQSGSNGREESQQVHLNPRSGRWVPDHTYRQRHVNGAIAYNVWQYYQATGDIEFLSNYGAELVLGIARFWASLSTWNSDRDRYEIHAVVGPDEFHTAYPDSEEPGLRNNAYTNLMAVWVLGCAERILRLLDDDRRRQLLDEFQISTEELERWDHISRRMYVPFHEGVISQFEGYESLEEFDWEGYRCKYKDLQRLDRILEAEGDDPNRYKAGKQADVLMLFYLFSAEELEQLFRRLGYPFDHKLIPATLNYYLHRTSHGSTLSRVVHSWVLARSDRQWSWGLFQAALDSDIGDIQGGTTSEGIHLGAMSGTVDLIRRGCVGLEIRDDVLWFNPCLPDGLPSVRFRIRYRTHWLRLEATHDKLTVAFEKGWSRPARIGFAGQVYSMDQGDRKEFPLR